MEEVICLVPELCSMTGLTDIARSDFRVMKVADISKSFIKVKPTYLQWYMRKKWYLVYIRALLTRV